MEPSRTPSLPLPRALFVLGVAGALSCGGDSPTEPASPPPPPPTVSSVVVSPDSVTVLRLGSTRQFQATVRDQNGAPMPTTAVAWTSTDESVATVDANGVATAVSEGFADIRADASGVVGTGRLVVIDGESRLFNGMAVARTTNDSIPVVVAQEGGHLLGVLGQMNAGGQIESTRGAILISGADAFTYWFGDGGMPARAVFNDHVLVFDNYTATTVDVSVVAPDGSTSSLEAVELAGNAVSRLRSGYGLAATPRSGSAQQDLYAALRDVGAGVEAIQCSSSLASAASSLGLSLLPCVGLIAAAANFVAEDNDALEGSGLAFSIVPGVGCDDEVFDVQSCVAFVTDGVSDSYGGATGQVGSLSVASVDVTVLTTGDVQDPDGYLATLEPAFGSAPVELPTNGGAGRWDGLLPGPYSVSLTEVDPLCEVTSGNPVNVHLTAGEQVVVAFIVECGGQPPVISNLQSQFVGVNTCDSNDGGPMGSEKQVTFDYTDENGDVRPDGHVQVLFEFFLADGSSAGGGAFMVPLSAIFVEGDGFAGMIGAVNCIRFGPAVRVVEDISLADGAGNLSNAIHVETLRPQGGNVAATVPTLTPAR